MAFGCIALYLIGLWTSSPVTDPREDRLAALLARPEALSEEQRQRLLDVLVPRELGEAGVAGAVDAEEEGVSR